MRDGIYKALPPINLPGIHVDEKTTYKTLVASLKSDQLIKHAYSTPGIRISFCNHTELSSNHNNDNEISGQSRQLIDLAVSAGEWSRFKIDGNMRRDAIELMYTAWLKNSLNKSLADETFIAIDNETNELAGLIYLLTYLLIYIFSYLLSMACKQVLRLLNCFPINWV